jgi:hypothetical protein
MSDGPAGVEPARRDVLRRAAAFGGALIWTAPFVQSVGPHALAQTNGSPSPGTAPSPGTSVRGVKRGSGDVAGVNLPGTGAGDAVQIAAVGTGLLATGAAAVHVARRRLGGSGATADPEI